MSNKEKLCLRSTLTLEFSPWFLESYNDTREKERENHTKLLSGVSNTSSLFKPLQIMGNTRNGNWCFKTSGNRQYKNKK